MREQISSERIGFSLTELIVTVIVLGILVAIALPQFLKTKENAIDREALTNLRLIYSAEKIYYLRYGSYCGPGTGIGSINSTLGLDLNENSFDYNVTGGGAVFTASAARSVYCNRTWRITEAGGDPTCSPCCP